jgi:2,3-diketo-5-methylthio-1-phosphopentane phosphatase
MAFKVFIDFDGTVTHCDVGNVFFRTFGGEQCTALVSAYRDGKMSAHQCFREEVAAMGCLDTRRGETFLHSIDLREGARELFATCREHGMEYCILSDGLDYYIRTILARHGIAGVPIYANALILSRNGSEGCRPTIEFPFTNAECDRCACCKRNLLLRHAGDDDVIVYVGDGYSDRCPVQYADVVFARGELQAWCQEQNISYRPYETLHDVRRFLDTVVRRKRVSKPARPALRRRDVFIGEA